MEHHAPDVPDESRRIATCAHVRAFEAKLGALVAATRLLPAVTPVNAAGERERLLACVERSTPAVPRWTYRSLPVPASAFRALEDLRRDAAALPAPELHLDRLDEIELDLHLLAALGRPSEVRAIARRRFGTGATLAPTPDGPAPLARVARSLLDATPPPEPSTPAPAVDPADVVRAVAAAADLDVAVRVEPTLAALAASGERTVFVRGQPVAPHVALRLAVHEVLGHLRSAEHGRAQPLRLLEWGTAGAFVDQEGVALVLEEAYGVLDAARLRVLAGRVHATDLVHAGASFTEAVHRLVGDDGFTAEEAVTLAERVYRGGGAARDVVYLRGWLRVRDALARGRATLAELQLGRVALDALPAVRALVEAGWARLPPEAESQPRLNFSRSFFSTSGGTTPFKSPPSWAASLIKLELT